MSAYSIVTFHGIGMGCSGRHVERLARGPEMLRILFKAGENSDMLDPDN